MNSIINAQEQPELTIVVFRVEAVSTDHDPGNTIPILSKFYEGSLP